MLLRSTKFGLVMAMTSDFPQSLCYSVVSSEFGDKLQESDNLSFFNSLCQQLQTVHFLNIC